MSSPKTKTNETELCEFFVANGYCTLGKKCKQYHDRTKYNTHSKTDQKETEDESDEDALTEICFSFDTTGSMYSWLTEVRKSISQIVRDLFKKIPNIRISIIAHGDYCDRQMYYVLKYIDFCRDSNKIIKFVNEAGPTGGGDCPECYELVLYEAVNTLSWSPESKSRALVVIGDANPHPPSYRMNTKNIDWRKETANLKRMGVTIYGIYCGHSEPLQFYKDISTTTGGRCLKLNQCSNIRQLFMALCLKNSNNRRLFEEYREQLLRQRQCSDELTNAINSIAGMIKSKLTVNYYHDDSANTRNRVTIASSVKRLMADLNEIRREKLINISIVPQSDDVFRWHINVKPLQGALSDIYVHLILSFPSEYPSQPPKIKLVTKIKNGIHPNITDNYVCLPLFGANNASKKSKYGSSWSAAYSITSLLVNISSIFTEINKLSKKQMDIMRECCCRMCGHSNTTPYPPLESNRLPIKMTEYDYNDVDPKANKKKNEKTTVNTRGVMIAGNILETVKPAQYWTVKSLQSIKRMDKCVAWQYMVDWLDRESEEDDENKEQNEFQSDIIFGFMNGNNIFFGINIDGYIVYDNQVSQHRIYENKIKKHDVLTYILTMYTDGKKDELSVYLDYKQIGKVCIPPYTFEEEYHPMMFLKDTRVQLNLNTNIELMNKVDINEIYFMCNLPQNAPVLVGNDVWDTNEYYKDRNSWDVLVERALSSDILLKLFTYLSYTDWIRCNTICTYWRSVLREYNVIDRNEMNCFYTKDSIDTNRKCILGVGLNVTYSDNNWITSVSTEMDFLSLNSYVDYNIMRGIWGERITHFLPLIINEKHAALSHACLMKRIYLMCNKNTVEQEHVDKLDEESALLAITAIMNQFVVQLMASCTGSIDSKHASEKALIGYCAFHHLLLYLAEKYPKLKNLAMYRMKKFITDETYRHKLHTPDLGKFLLNLAICSRYDWNDLKDAFIAECNVRNVKWYLKKYPHLEYYDMDRCSDKERIECTLKSSIISRRLVVFQVWFINNIARANKDTSLSDLLMSYNKRWGRPTNTQRHTLMKQIKLILKADEKYNFTQWMDYFNIVGIGGKFKSKQDILLYLRNNINKSRTRSYHQTNPKVLNANRLFAMKYKFNLKKELYQREYITKLNQYKIIIYKNPIQFEGIKIEYNECNNNNNHYASLGDWVNIYDEATHRWYIGYKMRYNPITKTCDVLYIGWNKHFLEHDVPLCEGRMREMNTFPLSITDRNVKQGFIEANGMNNALLIEEYEMKLDEEKRLKNDKDEKMAFYHREFFESVTDNDIERVKKLLRIKTDIINNKDEEEKQEKNTKIKMKTATRRGKRSGKKTKNGKNVKTPCINKKRNKEKTIQTSFYHTDRNAIATKEAKKSAMEIKQEEQKQRLFWANYNVSIDVHMTDAFGRGPLFLSCYMGHIEMTKLLLDYGFCANIDDINGETALDQVIYGKKQKYHNKECMQVYNMVSTAMQKQIETKHKLWCDYNNNAKRGDKYYLYIGGLPGNILENEMIDLCEVYDIYPNEMILNRGYGIIGVNDVDIMKKIYFMDGSFYRCCILNVHLYDGNWYDPKSKIEYPSNTLYVCNFDLIENIEEKLRKIFVKYGKWRRNTLLIKQNKAQQNFTFIEFYYVNNAIYAYNDVLINKHQHRFKLNTNENSNRRIMVRFSNSKNSGHGGFGGKMGGGRPIRNGNTNSNKESQTNYMKIEVDLPYQITSLSFESVESALCFIPPQHLWPKIQEIRKAYDPAFPQWMPHINILFPFVDCRYFDEIASFIENNIIKKSNFRSFDISLERFDVFDGVRNRMRVRGDNRMETMFLRPNRDGAYQMCILFEYLKQVWPRYARTHSNGYSPHCTVGKFTVSNLKYYRMQFQSNWRKISWKCDAIYLISRQGDKPFRVRNKIPFC